MNNPKDLKYTETHEWVRLDGKTATVGIMAHAAEALSDLVFLDLPEAGDTVTAGESFGEIESVKAVSELKSPVSGEILETNSGLPDALGDINSDPYGKGWMLKCRVSAPPVGLMSAAEYEAFIAEGA